MSDPEKLAEKARLERQDDELSGKSPVERGVYEGLQLDMREKRGFDDHSAWTSSDKLKKELEGLQASPVATHGNHYYRSPGRPAMVEEVVTDPRANERRICGMRRRAFWILFSVILAIIIIGAVIGGAVGGTRKHSPPPPPPPPPATSPPPPLPPYDIMAASPIKALAFEGNNSQNVGVQSFRLHYQSVNGNIKELRYDGILAGWHNATPIFTDARNHTGLATYMYLNGTALMGAMFYQDVQGILQEKRKKLATSDNWLPGSLGSLGLLTNGSFDPQPNSLPDTNPVNDWDGLNMAAVYSMNFPTGPGGRLYYHFTSPNGSAWIQELKWDQAADVWETGTTFVGGAPNSHIAATIDEQHKAVRVFYSTGNGTLQESWSNITQYNGTYNLGIKIPNLLPKTDADMAALTMNGSTLLYYYSNTGTSGIQELNITGFGSSGAVHGNAKNIVAEPALLSDGGALSQYTPLTAALAFLPGTTPAIHVFYADNTVSTTSGYSRLSDVSRPVDNGTWPASTYGRSEGQIQLPLGTESVDAHA